LAVPFLSRMSIGERLGAIASLAALLAAMVSLAMLVVANRFGKMASNPLVMTSVSLPLAMLLTGVVYFELALVSGSSV
jgi:hypothetical protein